MKYTLDEVTREAKRLVEGVGEDIEPTGDWIPVLLVFGAQSAIVAIPQLAEPELKECICSQIIPHVVRMANPEWLALVVMGWTIKYDPDDLASVARRANDEAKGGAKGSFEDHPDRQEVLTVTLVSTGQARSCTARVIREDGKPPRAEWYLESESISGRFPDAMRAAMLTAPTRT